MSIPSQQQIAGAAVGTFIAEIHLQLQVLELVGSAGFHLASHPLAGPLLEPVELLFVSRDISVDALPARAGGCGAPTLFIIFAGGCLRIA